MTLRIDSTVVGTTTVSMTTPGTRAPLITLTTAGTNLAQPKLRSPASLTFVNNDLAGNKRAQVARFTALPGINS